MTAWGYAMSATKIAMSLPADLLRHVEHVRKKTRRTRSAVMQDALRHWLARQNEAELVRQYEAGYRKRPETKRDIAAAERSAVTLLAHEEW